MLVSMGIKEIAEHAGVSSTTVSLALNGRKGVSDATRLRIAEIAEKLDYRVPSERANLTTKLGTIVFAKIRRHGLILNQDQHSFILDYIEGINKGIRNTGYSFEISTQRIQSITEFVQNINYHQPKGLIVLGTELTGDDIISLKKISVPYVVIDTYFEHIAADYVDMANVAALHEIIGHLAVTRHREIGMVTCSIKSGNVIMREKGFKLALEHYGMDSGPHSLIEVQPGFDGAYAVMSRFLNNNGKLPMALFCYNDIAAFGVIKALKEHHVLVPKDISVIGFDDLPMSSMMDARLTSYRIPNREIGSLAVSTILKRISSKAEHSPTGMLVSGKLVSRDSVIKRM